MEEADREWKELFLHGKYTECSSVLRKIVTVDEAGERLSERDNLSTLRYYVDNNLIVCDILAQDWETASDEQISRLWGEAFIRLSDLHGSLRCVQSLWNIPVELTLCVTFNTLWWTLMCVDPYYQHTKCKNQALNMISHTLLRVLNVNGDPQLGGSAANSAEEVLRLARSSVQHLHNHPPHESLLLVDSMLLIIILILDSEDEKGLTESCLELVDGLISTKALTRIHLSEASSALDTDARVLPLFRFGIHSVGDALHRDENCVSKYRSSAEALLLAGVLCCLRLKCCPQSQKFLQDKEMERPQYNFLTHYVKALVTLELGDSDRCLYNLSCCARNTMDDFMQARHSTKKGQAYIKSGNHQAALKVLRTTLKQEKTTRLPISAFLMAQSYSALGQTMNQIQILDFLVQCLNADQPVSPSLTNPVCGFEHRFLLSFHPQPEITLPEALYASAAAHLNTNPKIASEKLLDLLHLIDIGMGSLSSERGKGIASLPQLACLLRDTATALLRSGCYQDAQLVSRAALEHHVPFDDNTESVLYCLQQDVTALMLLAESQQKSGNLSAAQTTLNKATKVLQDEVKALSSNTDRKKDEQFLSAVLARAYLSKALVNVERRFSDDATACFQRAFSYNPDDTEVLLQFASHLLSLGQRDESATIWKIFVDKEHDENKYCSHTEDITLLYLLGDKTQLSERCLIEDQLRDPYDD